MELWNDYEGKVLDGMYPLEHLIGPKGRSAFFTTTDGNGEPATIRVIESLNDEDEILTRWNAVRAIEDPHLLRILACGKTVLDGVHLVYAVMERTDANLSEILKERALTTEETRQVAGSAVAALQALHARRLVHEHVEPENVLALGETVKLRGDCVREAPEGSEGDTLLRRDAHDLAMLVGYALTQRREIGTARLPRPFDDFVRNGMSGLWGLKEMGLLVRPVASLSTAPAPATSAPPMVAAAAGAPMNGRGSEPVAATQAARPVTTLPPPATPLAATLRAVASPQETTAPQGTAAQTAGHVAGQGMTGGRTMVEPARSPLPSPARTNGSGATSAQAVAASLRASEGVARGAEEQLVTRRPSPGDRIFLEPESKSRPRAAIWAGVAVMVALLMGLLWHVTHRGGSAAPTPEASAPVSANRAGAMAAGSAGIPGVKPQGFTKPSAAVSRTRSGARAAATAPAATAPSQRSTAGSGAAQWRLVAFTYNREDQAQHKAQAIAQAHPELKPEVFTPSGRAPYLVALGGWMSVAEAATMRDKARGDGMPHDIYTQNYRGR